MSKSKIRPYILKKDHFSDHRKPHQTWEGQVVFGSRDKDEFDDIVCHKPYGEIGWINVSSKNLEPVPFLGEECCCLEKVEIDIYSNGDYVSYEDAKKEGAVQYASTPYGYMCTMDVIEAMRGTCKKFGINECNVRIQLDDKITFECTIDQVDDFINACYENL